MIRALLIVLLAMVCCSPAKAQTAQIINCPLVSTTTFNSGQVSGLGNSIISNCQFTLAPTTMAYFYVQGTATCGANSDLWLQLVNGNNTNAYQKYGASFNGQITGSVLTVNSMITGPPNVIVSSSNPRLYDAFSGSHIPLAAGSPGLDTALWITSQQTSTEIGGAFGGKGTYNLNTSVGTPVLAETMWALPYRPTAVNLGSNTYEQKGCQNGTTAIVAFGGSLPATYLGPVGTLAWVQVEIRAESLGGLAPQSASFNNGQIIIVMPSMLQGGFGR